VEEEDVEASSDSDRGMGGMMQKVFGNKNSLTPTHISSPKHMTKMRFMNLSQGKYSVRL